MIRRSRVDWLLRILSFSLVIASLIAVAACAAPAAKQSDAGAAKTDTGQAQQKTAAPSASGQAPANKPAASESTRPATVRIAYVSPSTPFIWQFIAKKAGIFEKYGINADPVLVTGSTKLLQALVGGSFDIVAAGFSSGAAAAVNGADVVAIAALDNYSDQFLMIPPDSQIRDIAALKGKKIAVSTFGSESDSFLSAALAKAGLSRTDVQIFQTGGHPQTAAALASGQMDAGVLGGSNADIAMHQGMRVLTDSRKIDHRSPNGAVMTTRSYASSNRETILRVLKAMLEANKLYRSDEERALPLMQEFFKGLDPEVLKSMRQRDIRDKSDVPFVDREAVVAALKELQSDQPKASSLEPDKLFDNSYIQELEQQGFVKDLFGKK